MTIRDVAATSGLQEVGRVGPLAVSHHPGAIVELVHDPQGDGSTASTASWVAPALPACVGPLRRRVAAFAATRADGAVHLADLELAVSEAVTNAVIHAYRDRDQPGTVTAAVGTAGRRVEVVVTDGGVGMSPRPDSPGAGLGLALMAAVCDHVAISPGAAGKGTEVRMVFGPKPDHR